MAKIEYCPRCGATGFRRYRHGEEWMCKTCGDVAALDGLAVTWLKLERARVVSAAVWLADRYESFTRRQMADHLGVTKSPALRLAVDALADMPAFRRDWMRHPQNGCLTHVYSRKGVR
jgi:hypothetical protein